MYIIRTYNAISARGLERFNPGNYQLGEDVSDPDAIILRSHELHTKALPASVVAVARAGAGFNNIPVGECTSRGVVVFNTPGGNANAVKELVAAGLFLGSRDIYGGLEFVQSLAGITDHAEMSALLEKDKKSFAGSEIAGKTLGVVGLGAIGSMVANMALELGMNVAGFDPAISVEAAWQLSSRVKKVENLQALLAVSDYVTLHVPANEQTRGMIDKAAIGHMKAGVKLLNFAREEIVELQAVVAALDNGRMSRYITDFPRPGLLGRKDTVLLPHIGASTAEAEDNCAVMAAEQLMDFLENGNIANSVNFPPTRMARNGGFRITFSNHNVPRVLGGVLSVLADRNINVIDMVNKSRGEIAYNIIDVETAPGPKGLKEIRQVEGVIRLRLV